MTSLLKRRIVFNKHMLKLLKQDKCGSFTDQIINKMRPYHYGGIPAPILFNTNELNLQKCHERALLLALILGKEATLVSSETEFINMNSTDPNGGGAHSYVLHDNVVWDTTMGMGIYADDYFKLNKVENETRTPINEVLAKFPSKASLRALEMIGMDFNSCRDNLEKYLPSIQSIIKSPCAKSQTKNARKFLLGEIENLQDTLQLPSNVNPTESWDIRKELSDKYKYNIFFDTEKELERLEQDLVYREQWETELKEMSNNFDAFQKRIQDNPAHNVYEATK